MSWCGVALGVLVCIQVVLCLECAHSNGSICYSESGCFYFKVTQKEGPVQSSGCSLSFLPKTRTDYCIETLKPNVSKKTCYEEDSQTLCCCNSDQCNSEWNNGPLFSFNRLDFVYLFGSFLCVSVYSSIALAVCRLYNGNSLSLRPSIGKNTQTISVVLVAIRIVLSLSLLSLSLLPLRPTCSLHSMGQFSHSLRLSASLIPSFLLFLLLWTSFFYTLFEVIYLKQMVSYSTLPLHSLCDILFLIFTHFLWMSASFVSEYRMPGLLPDGEYCNYKMVRNLFRISTVITASLSSFDILSTVVILCFVKWTNRRKNNDITETSCGTNTVTSDSEKLRTGRLPTPLLEKNCLCIEPKPFSLDRGGNGILHILNTHSVMWVAVRIIVSAPSHYRITPQKALIPPDREITVEVEMDKGKRSSCKEHAIMLEWFVVGLECPSRDMHSLWSKPYFVSRKEWRYSIFPVYHEPSECLDSERTVSLIPSDTDKMAQHRQITFPRQNKVIYR